VNNFVQRTLTGTVFVAVLVAAIIFNQIIFSGLFFIITILGLSEFYKLWKGGGKNLQEYFGITLGALTYLGLASVSNNLINVDFLLLLLPLIMGAFIVELYRNKPSPFENVALTLSGVLYIAVPFGLLNFLYVSSDHYFYILLLSYFVLLWINDTFAYLFGMTFGKHRLFERISPKKSWEGSVGGGLTAILTAWIFSRYETSIPFIHWAVIALIIVVAGTLGDLVESMMKRSLQIKDSGNILPGHGGILDRFDAVLISAPIVFVYVELFVK
jgi:phosphatidate cytidylyltransferase